MPYVTLCSSSAAGPLPHPPPPAPFTPPRARAGRRRSGPATQKGGRRISFTLRPAPLPSRSGAMTPFPGCAAPPTHPKVMRRPPFPAPSTPRTAAAGAAGRALRVRARSIAAAGTSTGVARPDEAEKAPAEGASLSVVAIPAGLPPGVVGTGGGIVGAPVLRPRFTRSAPAMPATNQSAVSTLIREVLADPDLAHDEVFRRLLQAGLQDLVEVRGRRRDRRAAPRRARRSAPTAATARGPRPWPPPPARWNWPSPSFGPGRSSPPCSTPAGGWTRPCTP